MSLATLRQLRLAGGKPRGLVWVHLGDKHPHLNDHPAVVTLTAEDRPTALDWRPTVGLWVCLLEATLRPVQALATLAALEAAGAKFFGAADPEGVHPCIAPTEEHRTVLRRAWEQMCLT